MVSLKSWRRAPLGRASRFTVAGYVCLAVTGAVCAGAALAQTAPSADTKPDTGLEEVVVTAQFHRENLQQTPLAITAITGDMLTARSETTLQDVASQAPNVILQQNPAGGGNSMRAQIRGVGQSDFDPALDPGVGIYIDDVYFATLTGSDFALVDLDRVEILRGPQGTLSGMNSLGGSVKLYSKKATGGDDGYVEGTYGSFDRVELRASGDFTLVPGQLFFRLTGVSRRDNGYVQLIDYACSHPADPYVISGAYPRGNYSSDCKTGNEGGQDYTALRGSTRWVPNDALEVNWVIDATQDNSQSTATTLLGTPTSIFGSTVPAWMGAPYDSRFLPPNPYTSYANFLDPGVTYVPINTAGTAGAKVGAFYATPNNTLNAWGTSLTVDYKLANDLSIKSISAYRHYTSQFGDDNSASPVPLVMEEARFTHQQKSEELRLNGAWGTLVDYTLGGIYFDYTTYYASREDDPFLALFYGGPATPTFDFLQNDPTHTTTKAGFFNSGWHFTDAMTLNTGLRYTSEDKTYTYHRLNIDGVTPYLVLSNPADPLNGKVGEYSGSHVDYRLDLDYKWTPTLMTYAEFSTGFKGGGVTPRPYYPEQVIGFGPETLRSYEVGMKSEWFDHSLRANLAAFYQQYKDYQVGAGNDPTNCVDATGAPLPVPVAIPCGEYRNLADAVGKGFEAEFDYLLGGLQINASFSYLDQYFTHSNSTAVTVGQVPPDIGKVRSSIGAQYQWVMGGWGSLTPRLDVSYTPFSCGDLTCTPETNNPSYTLTNARLTYTFNDKKWSAALQVTNLTDKIYYLSRVNTGAGYIDGQIAPPREWALTLRRDF